MVGDQRFEDGDHRGIPSLLRARQRTGITTKVGEMRGDLLGYRHERVLLVVPFGAVNARNARKFAGFPIFFAKNPEPFLQARVDGGRKIERGCENTVVKKDKKSVNVEEAKVLDPQLDAIIGARLRSYYDTLLSEPVPDRILELLMQLDAKDKNKNSSSGSGQD